MAGNHVIRVTDFSASIAVATTDRNDLLDTLALCITIAAILLFLIGCIVIVANVFALISVTLMLSRKRNRGSGLRPNTSYAFVVNLALADLLIGLASIALFAYTEASSETRLHYKTCLVQTCFTITPCIESIFTMTVIGLDRYFCIMHPLKYGLFISLPKVMFVIVITWTASFIFGFAPLMGWGVSVERYFEMGSICSYLYVVDPSYVMYTLFGWFLPQLILIIYLYVKIFKVSREHKRKISQIHATRSRPYQPQSSRSGDDLKALPEPLAMPTQSCPVSPTSICASDTQLWTYELAQKLRESRPRRVTRSVSFSPDSFEIQSPIGQRSVSLTNSLNQFTAEIDDDNVFEYPSKPRSKASPSKPIPPKRKSLNSSSIHSCCSSSSNDHEIPKLRSASSLGTSTISSVASEMTTRIKSYTHLRKPVIKTDIKALRTVALVVGFYFLMWTPFLIVSVVQVICASRCELQALTGSYLLLLGIANSAINPLVYTYTNNELKKHFARFCCKKKRPRVITDHEPAALKSLPGTTDNCLNDR